MQYDMTRRKALIAGSGIALGTSALVVVGSDRAAGVSVDSFDVKDAAFEASQAEPDAIADVAYSWENADDAGQVRVSFAINGDVVDTIAMSVSDDAGANTVELSDRVTASSAFSSSDFEAPAEVTVPCSARLEVRDDDNGVIASAEAEDSGTISVAKPGELGDAYIGGEVTFEDSE